MVEELFSSYERDFLQHIALLQTAVDEKQDSHSQLDTAYHTCQMLMKQMEVEVVNHDDTTMRKVSPRPSFDQCSCNNTGRILIKSARK